MRAPVSMKEKEDMMVWKNGLMDGAILDARLDERA